MFKKNRQTPKYKQGKYLTKACERNIKPLSLMEIFNLFHR